MGLLRGLRGVLRLAPRKGVSRKNADAKERKRRGEPKAEILTWLSQNQKLQMKKNFRTEK
jgi:hypothetical protein